MNNAPGNSTPSQALSLMQSDINEFQQLFINIQQAYSEGDFGHLRACLTPEMQHYFNEVLAGNASRGLVNKIEQVQVRQVDQVESWREYDLNYACVIIHWTAIGLHGSPRPPIERFKLYCLRRSVTS